MTEEKTPQNSTQFHINPRKVLIMRDFAIIEAPSVLGHIPTHLAVADMPHSLLKNGLADKLTLATRAASSRRRGTPTVTRRPTS